MTDHRGVRAHNGYIESVWLHRWVALNTQVPDPIIMTVGRLFVDNLVSGNYTKGGATDSVGVTLMALTF